LQPDQPTFVPQDIELLNRYFSTKSLFEVRLSCDEEAKQVLQASLTNPSIQYAVSSLKALREDLETAGDIAASVVQHNPNHDYGLQQYCMALRTLASGLTSPSSDGLKSALLCCQIFVSIEQLRGNYATMAQHITQGLRIMHDYRARPTLVTAHKLVPAYPDQLPLLDVFIIKLFAAPCKFSDPPTTANSSETMASMCLTSAHQQSVTSPSLRTIAPNMRTELTRIATSTLDFLSKVSHVKSAASALQLLSEKACLLDALNTWLLDLELVLAKTEPPVPELLSVSFMRLFYQILRIILLGVLDTSFDFYAKLRIENERLQVISNTVGEGFRAYKAHSQNRNG
jgi:hypothetical protein